MEGGGGGYTFTHNTVGRSYIIVEVNGTFSLCYLISIDQFGDLTSFKNNVGIDRMYLSELWRIWDLVLFCPRDPVREKISGSCFQDLFRVKITSVFCWRCGCGIRGPVPFSPWIRDGKFRIRDPGYTHPESGTLFVRLREELEGVPVSRQKMKLVSLFMDEIQELVDDPAKARYKPIRIWAQCHTFLVQF